MDIIRIFHGPFIFVLASLVIIALVALILRQVEGEPEEIRTTILHTWFGLSVLVVFGFIWHVLNHIDLIDRI